MILDGLSYAHRAVIRLREYDDALPKWKTIEIDWDGMDCSRTIVQLSYRETSK